MRSPSRWAACRRPAPSGRCWRRRRRCPASTQELVEALLAARGRPVTLEDEPFARPRACRLQCLPPARQALASLPPVQWPGHDGYPPGTPVQDVPRREPADGAVVDADRRRQVLAGGAPHDDEWHRHGRGPRPQPGAIAGDLGDGPDDAVDLASRQTCQHLIDVLGLGSVDERERHRVARGGGRLLEARQDPRRPEVLEPVGDDAEGVGAALRESAGQHVGQIAGVRDHALDALEGLRGDIRAVVQHPRDGLGGDARRLCDVPDGDSSSPGHEACPPVRVRLASTPPMRPRRQAARGLDSEHGLVHSVKVPLPMTGTVTAHPRRGKGSV